MNKTLFLLLQVITCSLPLVGTGLFAYILFATVGDTSITEWSVSDAFASYPDYQQLLIVLIIASSIIFATTAIRNIQVRIWFRRRYGNYLTSCCRKQQPTNGSNAQLSQGSAAYLAFMNDFGSFVNIAAYVAFILLAAYPSGTGTPSIQQIHNGSSLSYFSLSLLYAILQTLLTCRQQHYPKCVTIIQIVLVISTAALSLAYGYTFFFTDTPLYITEWLAVIFNLVFVAFFAVLFHYDSAADELVEYACPCCCRAGKTSGDNASNYRNMP